MKLSIGKLELAAMISSFHFGLGHARDPPPFSRTQYQTSYSLLMNITTSERVGPRYLVFFE